MEVVPPPGAVARTPRALRLEEVPGAVVVVHHEWSVEASVVAVACVTRPVPLWLDELTPTALAGMNGLVRRHLKLSTVRAEAPTLDGDHWGQVFEGEGAAPLVVVGQHQLGFASDGRLLACTASCEGPTSVGCREALSALTLEPGFVARDASAVESTLSRLLGHPREVVGAVAACLMVFVVVWLARRPRD